MHFIISWTTVVANSEDDQKVGVAPIFPDDDGTVLVR